MTFFVVLLVLVAALVLVSVLAKVPASLYPKSLSHTAVEDYISKQYTATNVSCNDGKNFKMKNSATFTCSAAGNQTFTVTITDKSNGSYQVVKNG